MSSWKLQHVLRNFVRDISRFHHFKDGSCSCGDFCGLRTESGIAIIFKWCLHHVAHYCPVGSGSAALKIHVRTYTERLAIQVNNVMLLTPFGVISAVSSELCIANGSTDVGPWSFEQTEWPTQLLSCTVVMSYIIRKCFFGMQDLSWYKYTLKVDFSFLDSCRFECLRKLRIMGAVVY
jgi:hypothetical protein